ncbi:response regulator transcription factor [Dyadobacter sp. CY261]|uniref:response regulator transcription factor n=1 Tax=Dyadobacter sp. CY261 TaxID=2907203 RepID=UPI001F3385B9|nr:response regulator transcription factor [Dyadobacter sp. CY261]MCF0072485.1 response regulator transcription factor [Dyadobacter sp. CY261]
MKPIKIAIADDHKLFRQGLGQILGRNEDFSVVLEAASGEELAEKIAAAMPDVVLLDLFMKGMDGKEVAELLLKQYPNLKIIILSMNYSPEHILQLMRVGVHGYLPKDIDQIILSEAIEQVISKGYYINDDIAQVMRQGLQARDLKPSRSKVSIPSLNIGLTDREMEVLALICRGYNTARIAEELFISYRTVEGHRKNLLEKTGAGNSVSLAIFAVKHQLLDF